MFDNTTTINVYLYLYIVKSVFICSKLKSVSAFVRPSKSLEHDYCNSLLFLLSSLCEETKPLVTY